LEPLGLGELAQAFEALKAKLQAEGLFDPARKKPLPYLPRRLALVTSPTGAAVRDFLRLLRQRHPNIEVLIYPVKVQGAEAAGEIARALEDLNAYPGIEVIVLARGGGSLEDLWPFNEEMVARAIHRSQIPVVSAIGHEVDFTIADFVADVRAPTPSAAVELVVPDKKELARRLERLGGSLYGSWRRRLEAERRHLAQVQRRLPDLRRLLVDVRLKLDEQGDTLVRRVKRRLAEGRQEVRLAGSRLFLLSPGKAVLPARQRLDQSGQRLLRSWHQVHTQRRRHLDYSQSHLAKLDPMSILRRGYAVATKLPEGMIIRNAGEIPVGASVRVQVAHGRMDCEVIEVGES
jgi:exodeoxyribonuclease VII large subunit